MVYPQSLFVNAIIVSLIPTREIELFLFSCSGKGTEFGVEFRHSIHCLNCLNIRVKIKKLNVFNLKETIISYNFIYRLLKTNYNIDFTRSNGY